MPLPKRFFDPIDSLPEKIETFADLAFILPDEERIVECGKPHGLIWMQPNECLFLWNCARDRPRGTKIVEIGRCEGGSTLLLAASDPTATVLSIDIDPVDDDQLLDILGRYGLSNVLIAVGDSHTWPARDHDNIGLLLIDGNHAYSAIKKDFDNWWPMVVPGGMCLMHDVNKEGVGQGPWKFYSECILRDDVEPIRTVHTLALIRKKPRRKGIA